MSKKSKSTRFTPKLNIKKGDQVEVIAGASRGARGEVLEVQVKRNRAIVDGVNFVKKHLRPTETQEGGIVEVPAPIHLSNLMLVDPKTGDKTRVGRKIVDGKSVRYSKKSGEIIE